MNHASAISSAAIQPRGFPFRALLSVSGARSVLQGMDEDDVIALVESRRIEVAFNISLGEQDRRREIRILPAAVDFFKQHGDNKKAEWTWERIAVDLMAGYHLDWISALDARILLNCSGSQIHSIISLGRLALAPGSKCRPGPAGSPRVMLDSFLRWLKRRRVV